MGRGLSGLQKCILRLALENRVAPVQDSPASPLVEALIADGTATRPAINVYTCEVLVVHFGFPVRMKSWRRGSAVDDRDAVRKYHTGRRFDPNVIGRKRYAAAQAAVSRAFTRLQGRGLLIRSRGAFARWSGGQLTEKGFEVAQQIMRATNRPNRPIRPETLSVKNVHPGTGS